MLNKKPTTTTVTASAKTETVAAPRSVVTGRTITHEQIARRAYEIFKSGNSGSPEDNWFRAERELRARA